MMFARYSYGIAPRRGRRHGVPNLGSPVRRPRQRSMCGVPGFPSHTIFDPYGGRINGKCYTRPRGVAPYGVLTPGYQDGGTLCHSCPYGAYGVRSICLTRFLAPIGAVVLTSPRGCETYGLFAPGYQDGGTLCHFCPYRGGIRMGGEFGTYQGACPVQTEVGTRYGSNFISRSVPFSANEPCKGFKTGHFPAHRFRELFPAPKGWNRIPLCRCSFGSRIFLQSLFSVNLR